MNICILGPASCGKSTAATIFSRYLNALIVESDDLAHDAYAVGTEGWKAIVNHFGSSILESNQTIDRAKLGEIIFETPAERDFLRSVVDPYVRERVRQAFAEKSSGPAVPQHRVLVSYLMIERKWFPELFHQALVITSDRETCTKRMVSMRGRSAEYANAVLDAQLSNDQIIDEAKRMFGTRVTVISNNEGLANFERAIQVFISSLLATTTSEDQTRWADFLENESSHLLSIFIAEQTRASWLLAISGALLGIVLVNKPAGTVSKFSFFCFAILFLTGAMVFCLLSCYPVDGYRHLYRDFFGFKYRRMRRMSLDDFLREIARPGGWSLADYLLRVQYHYRSHWLIAFRRKRLMAWSTILTVCGVVCAAIYLLRPFI
jgi:dephospho-CoA kinase